MTKNTFLLLMLSVLLSSCTLDRSGLGCPEGTEYQSGGSLCVPSDASVADAGDAGTPDSDSGPDSGFDLGPDPVDAGMDSGLDAGSDPIDAGADEGIDAGTDSGPTDAGARRCEDTTTGICIRVTGVPLLTDWVAQFNWTRPGGSLHTIDWTAGQCVGGIRAISADTTECEMVIPDPGTPVIDTGLAYIYPTHSDGASPCVVGSCPGFPGGYRLWIGGAEYPTDPATPGGRVSLENRPALDGSHAVMRMNLP